MKRHNGWSGIRDSANNNEEFVGTEGRRERIGVKGKRAFSDPRSLNAFSLALYALNDEEKTLYVSRWKKKKEKRKGKKVEREREREAVTEDGVVGGGGGGV